MKKLHDVRKGVHDELVSTRLIRDILDGKPDLAAYARYLMNVRYYAQFSPVVMALGASRCVATHPELAGYLLQHADEEKGHDAWALADLEDLGVTRKEALAARPVDSCQALVGYVHFLAGHDRAIGLFGWMFVLEAVGNDLGGIAGQKLGEGLGEARSAVRFVAGHGVADTDHTREIIEQIDRYVTTPEDQSAVLRASEVVAGLYVRMFREFGGETATWA